MPNTPTKELIATFTQLIKDNEVMPIAEAKQWVLDNAPPESHVTDKTAGLIISSGYSSRKVPKIWHKEGEYLVWGPRNEPPPIPPSLRGLPLDTGDSVDTEEEPHILAPASTEKPRVDVSVLEDPKDQFATTGILVGIKRSQADPAAFYVARTANLYDPSSVWHALNQCIQIMPAHRTLWFNAWVQQIKADVPEEIMSDVRRQMPDSGDLSPSGRIINRGARLWTVVDGQPLPTAPDDPLGVPFHEALRWSEVERQRQREERERQQVHSQRSNGLTDQGIAPVLSELVKQQGETERKRMDVASATAQQQPRSDGVSFESLLKMQQELSDSQRRESEARISSSADQFTSRMEMMQQQNMALVERMQENHRNMIERMEAEANHRIEMMQQQNQHSLDLINTILDKSQSGPTNVFQMMDQMVPGLGKSLADRLTAPPPAPGGQIISLDGKPMTVETAMAINDINTKRQVVDAALKNFPEFLQLGRDLVQATNRVAAQASAPSPNSTSTGTPPTPQSSTGTQAPGRLQKPCAKCGVVLVYDADAPAFVCRACNTPQKPNGEILVFPAPTPTPPSAPNPSEVPVQGPPVSGVDSSEGKVNSAPLPVPVSAS